MTASLPADLIIRNLEAVRSRIERAARRSGRRADEVRLVAVSKTFDAAAVVAAASAGQRDFGENRVQEALQKIAAAADNSLRWHLIGHLQANKVRKAVGPFASIHSIDSLRLLERLDAAAAERSANPELLIQVDLAREPTKSGAPVEELAPMFEAARALRSARVSGLMLLPPWSDDAEQTRPYFQRLRALRDELGAGGIPASMLGELSMGMSHDFEVAIEEGATTVRVGTAIFGRREPAGDA